MAKVSYEVCDRCGEKINYHSRLRASVQYRKRFKIKWIITGVVSDQQLELCGKCAEELETFLAEKVEANQALEKIHKD